MLDAVTEALRELRPPFALYESDIHGWVEKRLLEAGLPCVHEAAIGPRCRIDFLVGNVGVEIKKGKPSPGPLAAQLRRYAACPAVAGLVVLTQRGVKVPQRIAGKPVRQIVLSQLWGVALP